ncbi:MULTISPECIES: ABC transporter ATP-binding protein [unclassified Methanosarcina]|uniref:ABC transporter ATP-binding protein n=1 Tax=unclassified Methanosarcina TaxID=2644672 RepID=UPI0006159532|nr:MULTISPECIES: ABC transporter ATP-binding protein [unclassified Methanosarcina]AKB16912.1 Oligopeptide transport system permease protein OppB [Methanosarcina sp. WWM596]AKB20317.1 Oligopeptide transport system permease protein OppB [Methanosarcina sp. WH1]
MPVLDIEGLTVDFTTRMGTHHVLKNVNLHIERGEIVGLIGESGCGKSTLAMSVLDINTRNRDMSGQIRFMGEDLQKLNRERMRELRGRHIGFIPQASMNALNPLVRVKKQFLETIRAHVDMPEKEMLALSRNMLSLVSIDPGRMNAFPYEFSGGQRQRLMIALSMLLSPELIIADEPTTALDAMIQLQIIDLLKNMVREKDTSLLVISHDLHTISRICDRIYIMYAGRIVEVGTKEEILRRPLHPYTQKLLSSRLPLMVEPVRVKGIPGRPPSTLKVYQGCEFLERCEKGSELCREKKPPECTGSARVSCHLFHFEG